VGGTGFYIRALLEPLFSEPQLDAMQRERLGRYLATLDSETLRAWCRAVDPDRSTLGRTQLLRAIEVATLTGRRLSELFRDSAQSSPLAARYLVIDPGSGLREAIARRVDDMLRRGWLDEVRSLTRTVPASAPAWKATGYDVLRRYVEGEARVEDLAAARTAIVTATRQYAKRQRTWFRHQLQGDIQMLDPNESSAMERALEWWHGASV
jgi:tRNA dimethylallyltransferase